MKRINLTQHEAAPEQGCIDRSEGQEKEIKTLLTFTELPDGSEIASRAKKLADIAKSAGADEAMIGGAPYLMGTLDLALRIEGIKPVYAFSIRKSIDEKLPDGSVIKRGVFKHVGFVRL